MPFYRFKCEQCGVEIELVRAIDADSPLCCNQPMTKLFDSPSLITIKDKNGNRTYSKGYKDGYSQEYLKSIGKG